MASLQSEFVVLLVPPPFIQSTNSTRIYICMYIRAICIVCIPFKALRKRKKYIIHVWTNTSLKKCTNTFEYYDFNWFHDICAYTIYLLVAMYIVKSSNPLSYQRLFMCLAPQIEDGFGCRWSSSWASTNWRPAMTKTTKTQNKNRCRCQ